MKAMHISRIVDLNKDRQPLDQVELSLPEPGECEVRVRVSVCGVCHTELDEIEGRTRPPQLPVVPGHEVIGVVDKRGSGVNRFCVGDRVGVGWIHWSSGGNTENISEQFQATGRDVDGGYAEYMIAHQDYAFSIPSVFSDSEAAPLLCAGSVGYRALKLAGVRYGQKLGFTGFGGSAHIVLQLAQFLYPTIQIYVFARDPVQQQHALELGAHWAGPTEASPNQPLDAIIDTTPAWKPVLAAMENLRPGGRLVINAIRKEDSDLDILQTLDYSRHLWLEKEIKTVANVTAEDIRQCLEIASRIPLKPAVEQYQFSDANQALCDLKAGKVRGAKVLMMEAAQ
ncbi:MAG: alcohol dehydrogenase catalytic domain-containing protein [Arenicellales bacterium]